MAFRITIPKYTGKDFPILVASMLPMAALINYFLYDSRYFSEASTFIYTTITSFIYLAFCFLMYGFVAISLRNRLPNDSDIFKRISICLGIFFLMSAVAMSLLLLAYDRFHFCGYQYTENDFVKCYLAFMVINIFLTFLNEGVYRFEKYKTNATQTEQLKLEFMHSQLIGLKSQMNPHFLFNSLNTLSSLIQENANEAEDFLDHMSKVYRYLLRNNEGQLVSIETELNFVRSYYFLLKARYADGLEIHVAIEPDQHEQMIPPLTLQMIIENAMSQNAVSRSTPLKINIRVDKQTIEIKNNIQRRINLDENPAAIENIANKFRLLCDRDLVIHDNGRERIILLPLIANKETSIA